MSREIFYLKVGHSDTLCQIIGYPKSEIIGQDFRNFIDEEDRALVVERYKQRQAGEAPLSRYEFDVVRKDGTKRRVDMIAAVSKDSKGSTITTAQVRDITEQVHAEKAFVKSEEKFRKAFYTILDAVSITRLEDGMYVAINHVFTSLWGYTEEDIIGKTTIDHNLWDNAEDRQQLVAGLKKGREVIDVETTFRTKAGDTRHGVLSASLIDLDGVPHILSVTHDTTARHKRQKALKESESKYRLLADNVNDVIFTFDMDLNYTHVSSSVKTLRGYEPEEVLEQKTIEVLTPPSLELAMGAFSEIMELEKSRPGEFAMSKTLDLEVTRKDGTTVWTETSFSFIRDENQQLVSILGVSRDITKRRQAEEELQKTLESLRNAVGTTIQVMISALEARDPYTAGHQARVADLSRDIATEMGLSQEKSESIHMAASIHDIGKLSIPAEILSSPAKLTENEFALIKEHSWRGYEILKDVESPWPLAEIVYQHHERMDGSGYPRNLKGDDILMEARIIAVADVVEAMASHRPYRAAIGLDVALDEIEKNRGILYDDTVADACLSLFREKGFQFKGN